MVAVTVYTVVVAGEALMVAPEAGLNPVVGLQVKVFAVPLTDKVAESPKQMEGLFTLI